MKPGRQEFMAYVAEARHAQELMLGEIVAIIKAGEAEEEILYKLGSTMHADLSKAGTAAMTALYSLAEASLKPPKSCSRHECYRCQIEDL